MSELGRHWLVWPEDTSRKLIRKTARALVLGAGEELLDELIFSGVPAIIRRQQDPRDGFLQVGFSSHRYIGGSRLRVDAELSHASIKEMLSPHAVIAAMEDQFWRKAEIDAVLKLGQVCNVAVGVYGSTALQMVTNLPYMRPDSDLDLYLRTENLKNLLAFYKGMEALQHDFVFLIDAEFAYHGYGIKLKEYISSSGTVLGKGLHDAVLFQKEKDGGLRRLED